jgi:Zinc carboxypeptidase
VDQHAGSGGHRTLPCGRYLTVDETASAARALTERRPDVCRLRRVGTSRAGEPLLLLSVGNGRRHTLVVAVPHPNELVGAASALRLAELVAGESDLHVAPDVTWNFLLCLDPDGAHRNEAWVHDGQFSMDGHFRNFFRPVSSEQPEWLPVAASGRRPLPETRTLTAVIDGLRPFLQFSLHGVDVGGSYVQLTRDLPGLAEPLGASAAELDIPLETGSYDAFYWPSPAAGVYVMPPPGARDQFAALPEDVALSTWYYPHRYGGSTAVIEVPMWATDQVSDVAPHPDPDQALADIAETLRSRGRQVAELLAQARPLLPAGGPLLRAVEETVGWCAALPREWDPSVERGWRLPPMTMARVASLEISARRIPLRASAMLLRLLEHGRGHPEGLHETLDQLVADGCAAYAKDFQTRWIPVDRQVEHQTRTVLAAFQQAV